MTYEVPVEVRAGSGVRLLGDPTKHWSMFASDGVFLVRVAVLGMDEEALVTFLDEWLDDAAPLDRERYRPVARALIQKIENTED